MLTFVVAGIGCAFAGLCYAEFAAMIPIAGSAYTYGYATLGELMAWIIGWDLVLEYAFGAATVASGWSGYMSSLLGYFGIRMPFNPTPSVGMTLFGHPFSAEGGHLRVLRNYRRHDGAGCGRARVGELQQRRGDDQGVGGALLHRHRHDLCLWASGAHGGELASVHSEEPGTSGSTGGRALCEGRASIFFAYIGFDAVSTAAQEAKNPQKDMPFGILGSLMICTILYIIVCPGC